MNNIQFSPPDISQLEIEGVVQALKSGWITTGPKTKLFEQKIAIYCGTNKAVCLNSATACLEMALRMIGVGPGDEVIVPAYTYTASASVVDHVGAKIVFIDVGKDSYELDYDAIADAITERTKVIIPVDIGGVMCDYDRIFGIINEKKSIFRSSNEMQEVFGRIIVLADAAHSFGAEYKGRKSGSVADFTSFSFHAVKNLTTAEGGALTWVSRDGLDDDELYKKLMLWTLHGQSKDALNKMKLGAWEYDIVYPAYKCNMTDITAAMGIAQLNRFDGLIAKRKRIYDIYKEELAGIPVDYLIHDNSEKTGNYHLFLSRPYGIVESQRNEIIAKMAKKGIACNVHFKPLPLMTAYKNLGFDIKDYPNAYAQYVNEITLPMHTLLSEEDARLIARAFRSIVLGQRDNANGFNTIAIERIWSNEAEKLEKIKKIHSDCGEKMFIEDGLLHWADPLPIEHWSKIAIEQELYSVTDSKNNILGFFSLNFTGNAFFDPQKKGVMLGRIAIDPPYQRKRIGSFCIDWIKAYALKRGYDYLQTTAYVQSVDALAFFENQGFVRVYDRATKHFIVGCFEIPLK